MYFLKFPIFFRGWTAAVALPISPMNLDKDLLANLVKELLTHYVHISGWQTLICGSSWARLGQWEGWGNAALGVGTGRVQRARSRRRTSSARRHCGRSVWPATRLKPSRKRSFRRWAEPRQLKSCINCVNFALHLILMNAYCTDVLAYSDTSSS